MSHDFKIRTTTVEKIQNFLGTYSKSIQTFDRLEEYCLSVEFLFVNKHSPSGFLEYDSHGGHSRLAQELLCPAQSHPTPPQPARADSKSNPVQSKTKTK